MTEVGGLFTRKGTIDRVKATSTRTDWIGVCGLSSVYDFRFGKKVN